jgi:hypothetical protein
MKPVQRSELLDYVTYDERRESLRAAAMEAKSQRRIIVGEHFTFLFENRDTVRYQVQEMMRTERIVKESDIQHELDTYNELLGADGELGCTLLIGIDDEEERADKLHAWLGLCDHLYAELEDGTRVRPRYDPRQVGDERLSSVQYLVFAVGSTAPVTIGVDMPGLEAHAHLDASQRSALQADLDDR